MQQVSRARKTEHCQVGEERPELEEVEGRKKELKRWALKFEVKYGGWQK